VEEVVFSGWLQRTLQGNNCRRKVSADKPAVESLFCGLALPEAECSPQRLLRLTATATDSSPRVQENAISTAQKKAVFELNRGIYDAPRIHKELKATGRQLGGHRVARLMRRALQKAKTRRGFRRCRESSGKTAAIVRTCCSRRSAQQPPSWWDGDITYIRTTAGWRYLAFWIYGYYSRERRHSTIG
jgi:hypothetical protein